MSNRKICIWVILFFLLSVIVTYGENDENNKEYQSNLQDKYSISCSGCTKDNTVISSGGKTGSFTGANPELGSDTSIEVVNLEGSTADVKGGYSGTIKVGGSSSSTIEGINGVFELSSGSKATIKDGVVTLEKANQGSAVQLAGKNQEISGSNIEVDSQTNTIRSKNEITVKGRSFCCNAEITFTVTGYTVSGADVSATENNNLIAQFNGKITYHDDRHMTLRDGTKLSEFKNGMKIREISMRDVKSIVHDLEYFSENGKCNNIGSNCLSIDNKNNLNFYLENGISVHVTKFKDSIPYKISGTFGDDSDPTGIYQNHFFLKELVYNNDGTPTLDPYKSFPMQIFSTIILAKGIVTGEGSPKYFTGHVDFDLENGHRYKLENGMCYICTDCIPVGEVDSLVDYVNKNAAKILQKQQQLLEKLEEKWGTRPMRILGYLNDAREQTIIGAYLRASELADIDPYLLTASSFQEGANMYMDFGYYFNSRAEVDGYGALGLDTFGNDADNLKKLGFLRQDFNEYKTYDTFNEKDEQVTSATFENIHYAIEAQAARLKYAEYQFERHLKKLGYNPNDVSAEEKKAWTYAYYNAGPGGPKTDRGCYILLKKYGSEYINTGNHAAVRNARRVMATRDLLLGGDEQSGGIYDPSSIILAQK